MTTTPRRTPVREALAAQSTLAVHVQDGMGAVKDKDKKFIDASIRTQFADSLDTDEAFRVGRDQEPRWDYLLGHENRSLVGVEPPPSAKLFASPCLLDQLASPDPELAASGAGQELTLEQLIDQLPAAQATALRLTVLEGLSLRQAASRLEISTMSVQRAQKKALAALREQLAA
jgi:RNA polymerase sigma factor (sigma-70 family)